MRRLAAAVLLSSLALSTASGVAAQTTPCPLTEEQFVQQLKTMTQWSSIYSAYKQNLPGCPDDGMFAEGYSAVVVVAFANNWRTLKEFERLSARDPAFRSWALGHIDATAGPADLQRIVENATAKCPRESRASCNELGRRAKDAIAKQ
jgi:hypothetical protein